jgi:hypothetical protein
MKLTSILKEIVTRPSGNRFKTTQQLVDYIKEFPGYKEELINAVYSAANFQQSSGWLDIKSDFIDGKMFMVGDVIELEAEDDVILISLEPIGDETDEGSFTLNGDTFYYGFT